MKFKVVNTDTPEPTSATPEPASATPEPPEVPSVNKFFAKPYEETGTGKLINLRVTVLLCVI